MRHSLIPVDVTKLPILLLELLFDCHDGSSLNFDRTVLFRLFWIQSNLFKNYFNPFIKENNNKNLFF